MTNTVGLVMSYTATATATVTLPDGYVWENVESYGIKWDEIFIAMKDGTSHIIALDCYSRSDEVDTKRPDDTEIYALDEDSEIDWGNQIA